MTDFANLVLAIDSTSVKTGAASLDGLTAAGARAEAATLGLGRASKGSAVEAATLAASAQAAARAAVGQAAGFGAVANAVRGNTVAMRETLVVTRELLNGNLTRLPGSLSILAQQFAISGKGASGFASQILQSFGIIKTVTDAELASEAAAARVSAAAIESAAARAQANVLAADTEVALAQAAIKTAATTEALTAAQAELATAHEAVAAAAAEATVAEVALKDAMAAEAVAAEAAASATAIALGPVAVAIGAVLAVAAPLALALEGVKQAAASDAEMKQFIDTLGLTEKEMKKLKDTTVTWGDVTKATFQVLAEKAGINAGAVKTFFSDAFHSIGEFGKFSIAVILAAFGAMVKGTADLILNLPAIVGGGIAAAANLGIAALEQMVNFGIVGLNKLGGVINRVLGTDFGQVTGITLGRVQNSFGGTMKAIGADVAGTFHDIFNRTEATFDQISARATRVAQDRLRNQAEALIADRTNKAAAAHHERAKAAKEEADALSKLDEILAHLLVKGLPLDSGALSQGSLFEAQGPKLDNALGKLPDYANQFLDTLRQISDQAQVTGQSLADAFGRPGDALGKLLATLVNYGTESQRINTLVADQADRERQLSMLRTQTTAAALSSLKGLFKEHSAGYKAMEAAEKAYALIQVINTIKYVAAGAAKMFAQLGVWAFPAVAAMAAVMAGFAFSGGSSTQKAPTSPEDLQKSAGAGTILGDATAKSASIANSLDLMAKNSTKGLDYSSDMVTALRGIQSGIDHLATSIAREFQAGGAFDTAGLGLGTKSSGIQGLFGSKTTTSLYDQGIQFSSTDLASAIANGISGATYQIVESVKKSSGFLGLGGSTKTSYSTSYGALDPDMQRQIGLILGSLRDSVVQAAKVLGFDVGAALNTFQVEIGKISFKDLTGDQITQQLNAVFSKVADQMAGFAVAGLEQFQKAGEGLFETLSRLAKDYLTIDAALKSIGKTFGSVGAASIAMREKLIDLAGGLDQFVNQVNFFYDHFLTDAQKTAFLKAQVDATFKSLGLAVPTSVAGFAKLVTGANLSTDAGQKLFESLMQIAPAFYEVATAADQLVATSKDNLLQAYKRESAALQQTADTFHKFADGLRAFRDSLFTIGNGSLGYNGALVQLMKQAGLATGGDQGALGGGLQNSAQQFLDVATANAHSLLDVQRARGLVARYLDQAIGGAEGQASIAEQQLAKMKDQVGKLIDINDSVLSVADAIKALTAALAPAPVAKARGGLVSQIIADSQGASVGERLDNIRAAIEAVAVSTGGTHRILRNADRGGSLALVTDDDQPIKTQAV